MKILKTLLLSFLFLFSVANVHSMTFEEAYNQSTTKPMLMLVYAQWADGCENCLTQFRSLMPEFGESFNFVELDIASKDAKSFNEKYHIYPKLPYILMYRDGGKVSRYIPRDCASSSSCVIPKVKSFIQ